MKNKQKNELILEEEEENKNVDGKEMIWIK